MPTRRETTPTDDQTPPSAGDAGRQPTVSRRAVATGLAMAGAALAAGASGRLPATRQALVRRAAAQSGDVARDADGNMFPTNRIVAWYGTSVNNLMGILGEADIEATWAGLEEQVAAWQAADPDTIAVPAWEYIATVAQPEPMSDGTFLFDIAFDVIQPYIDYAAERGGLTFVDCQVGRRGVQGEVERLRPLLVQPTVHLAIDPEYAMAEGETPGVQFGSIDAADVNWALRYLADLAVEEGVPQKTLMVHQFRWDMIENKENIEDVPGVELVLHADGHGAPELKRETYDVVISQWAEQVAFWAGFKVFYNKEDPTRNQYTDQPNMTPEEILQLDPVPYFISYQ